MSNPELNPLAGLQRTILELMNLVRQWREKYYFAVEYQEAHDREWENEQTESQRIQSNARRHAEWEAETKRLLDQAMELGKSS